MIKAKILGRQRTQIDRWPIGEGFKNTHIVSIVSMSTWTAKPTAIQLAEELEKTAQEIRRDHE